MHMNTKLLLAVKNGVLHESAKPWQLARALVGPAVLLRYLSYSLTSTR